MEIQWRELIDRESDRQRESDGRRARGEALKRVKRASSHALLNGWRGRASFALC